MLLVAFKVIAMQLGWYEASNIYTGLYMHIAVNSKNLSVFKQLVNTFFVDSSK